jgi:hypothetical protein
VLAPDISEELSLPSPGSRCKPMKQSAKIETAVRDGSLFRLLFDAEEGDDKFLRNILHWTKGVTYQNTGLFKTYL